MKKLKTLGTLMLTLCVGLSFCTGCGSQKVEETPTAEIQTPQAETSMPEEIAADEQGETRTITDLVGHEVTLPAKVERVVITSPWPLPSVYCLFKGSAEGLVGIHPASKSAAEQSLLMEVAPDIKEASTSFVQNGEFNIEELLKLEPDVVLGSSDEEYEMASKAGIPYVEFTPNPTGDWNTIDTVEAWLNLLGEIFNESSKVTHIMEAGHAAEQEIESRLADLKEEEKVKALIIFKHENGKIQVIGSNHFGAYWLEETGAVNVAAELKGPQEVNMEQIYAWNPDKIYITNFTTDMPEDYYNNTIEGEDWSSLKAVQNSEVYKVPLGMYRWYTSSSDAPLMLKWLAKNNYPELFEDMDMNEEVKNYYKSAYGIDLTDEQVEKIFSPSREAALGV